jgi:hypothetical protein
MPSRRAVLGWFGFVGTGVLAHHRPGHGPPTTTTTTTTTVPPPTGGVYSATYTSSY